MSVCVCRGADQEWVQDSALTSTTSSKHFPVVNGWSGARLTKGPSAPPERITRLGFLTFVYVQTVSAGPIPRCEPFLPSCHSETSALRRDHLEEKKPRRRGRHAALRFVVRTGLRWPLLKGARKFSKEALWAPPGYLSVCIPFFFYLYFFFVGTQEISYFRRKHAVYLSINNAQS